MNGLENKAICPNRGIPEVEVSFKEETNYAQIKRSNSKVKVRLIPNRYFSFICYILRNVFIIILKVLSKNKLFEFVKFNLKSHKFLFKKSAVIKHKIFRCLTIF